jgi:hypothetical protein
MFLPKAGVFADAEARVVAETIAAEVAGTEKPSAYDGRGFCYIEVGGGMAAYGAGNFYGLPGPTGQPRGGLGALPPRERGPGARRARPLGLKR